LAGLGFDEISAATNLLAGLKSELAGWPVRLCRELVQRALTCATGEEVTRLLEDYVSQAKQGLPLLEPELVVLDSQASTKEEAVKELADRLYVLGRTEQPRELEEAVWQRELVYSTGFGFGFAIPHCQTNAVTASSLAVLKLHTPVAWGSADGQPAGMILLLAIRQSDQAGRHLKVLAQLARKLMHEEFRERLIRADDEQAICRILEAKAKG
jgi:fructose-specific PTS system IIA-like component